ncbi:MAG: hypothetical protein GXY87_04745 [Tissierellia bacterium]|nr:hypothetical protein [Tissierellia bacterium]
MELIIILGFALALSVYFYFQRNIYIKQKVKSSWGKKPSRKMGEQIDVKSLIASMKILRNYLPHKYYIDKYTYNDLDMIKVFEAIDKSNSSIGEQYLYTRLRNFGGEDDDLEEFQKLKDQLNDDIKLREHIEYIFFKIGRNNNAISIPEIIEDNMKEKKRNIFVYFGLALVLLLSYISMIVLAVIESELILYALVPSIVFTIINYLIYRENVKEVKAKVQSTGHLAYIIKESSKFARMNLVNSEVIKKLTDKVGKISFWANFRYVDTFDLAMATIALLQNILLLPLISYLKIIDTIQNNKDSIIKLYMELGKIEAAISALNYEIYTNNTSKPKFIDQEKIQAESVIHPLLEKPIDNAIDLDMVNIVTGSNASGKSTYAKSVAINAILAQSLNLVHATKFEMKKGGVMTSMAIKDDIISGESYFIAELKSLKRIVDNATNGNFSYYFIDEILKGTNTIERIAASRSIIDYLIEKDAKAFIASHDIELTTAFGDSVRKIHFREQTPFFSFNEPLG